MGRRRKIVAQIGVHKTTLAALARIAKKETDGELISALERETFPFFSDRT